MDEEYRKLLDTTYELEGLLMLALGKETVSEELAQLIERKRQELALTPEEPAEPAEPAESAESEEPSEREDPTEVDDASDASDASEPRDLEGLEDPADSEAPVLSILSNLSDLSDHSESPEEEPFYVLDDDEPTVEIPRRSKGIGRHKPVFSLNDKFLFIRELFDGDAGAFNKAVDVASGFDSYDEAENFLTKNYHLNPDNDTDERFLSIIRSAY